MEWITILKCPISGADLRKLETDEINNLNIRIKENNLWQSDGKLMTTEISEGLITSTRKYIYPIIEGIILLLPDLAVVDSKEKIKGDTLSDDKKLVKDFYAVKFFLS